MPGSCAKGPLGRSAREPDGPGSALEQRRRHDQACCVSNRPTSGRRRQHTPDRGTAAGCPSPLISPEGGPLLGLSRRHALQSFCGGRMAASRQSVGSIGMAIAIEAQEIRLVPERGGSGERRPTFDVTQVAVSSALPSHASARVRPHLPLWPKHPSARGDRHATLERSMTQPAKRSRCGHARHGSVPARPTSGRRRGSRAIGWQLPTAGPP
jgi:hypothetical protein